MTSCYLTETYTDGEPFWSGSVSLNNTNKPTGALKKDLNVSIECYTCGQSSGKVNTTVYVNPGKPNLSGGCTGTGSDVLAAKWTSGGNTVRYGIRLEDHDDADGFTPDDPDYSDDNYAATSFSRSGIANHTYTFWVHGISASGLWGPAAGISPTCPACVDTYICTNPCLPELCGTQQGKCMNICDGSISATKCSNDCNKDCGKCPNESSIWKEVRP